ncbi:MAG: alpha-ketoacid dehydrogenase subunit beta [Ardenticatenia bacterium]|nr:MAG: alpha-ketoacid dehydrogenase subunit beta [Ardenticatenia bacterium]
MREITIVEALREALAEEMSRDPTVFLMGEDIGRANGVFNVTAGLQDEFGKERVIDTPISEAGFTGMGIGAALTGMRPVVEILFCDFMTLAMDQIVNQAAKLYYMTGGQAKVPLVVRTLMGAGRGAAAQHSQSLHVWVAHIPGLKVVMPSTPYDAKGLLKSAIRDDNPVIFFEDKMSYQVKGLVPVGEYTIPLGVADVKRVGTDVTFVATSSMVQVALAAAEVLEQEGISAEVVDPRTLKPLDKETILESVKKTGRAVVIDEGHLSYGVTAEIAAIIADEAFDYLDAPVKRLGAMDVPVPMAPVLEQATVPNVEQLVATTRGLFGRRY